MEHKKKNIWIFNHYATDQFFDHGGRHYCFGKHLMREGYKVTIFCATTVHNTENNVSTKGKLFLQDSCDGLQFVFIKARNYSGNGYKRILNMIDYYYRLFHVVKKYKKPDVIIGSSVHPLACVASIRLGKKNHCKAIVEIRDLWPESIVAYGFSSEKNPIITLLYQLEKWIYTKADAIVFTMEGGRDYIVNKGWDVAHGGTIDLNKVYHINNGVDLAEFDENSARNDYHDADLENPDVFKVVYSGSIRHANQVQHLVEVAEILKEKGAERTRILIWGYGDKYNAINQKIEEKNLDNIKMKGCVPKTIVPQILAKSDLNVYLLVDSPLFKFGLSLNKSFEYFASGKPVIASSNTGYSIIDNYKCGICLCTFTPEAMADEIIRLSGLPNVEYQAYCDNARKAAHDYDYEVLTKQLIGVIEN